MNWLIKLYRLPLLLITLSTVCFVSCTDELIPNVPVAENEVLYYGEKERLYFSFRLDMADGTPRSRAEGDENSDTDQNKGGTNLDFVDGTPDSDSRVNNVLIIFYDENGSYLAHFDSDDMKNHKYKDDLKEESQDGADTGDEGNDEGEGEEGEEGSDKKEDKDPEIPEIEEIHWGATISVPVEIYNSVKDKKFHSFYALVNYDDEIKKQFIKTVKNSKNEDVEIGISRIDLLSTDLTTDFYMTKMGFLMTTPGYFFGSNYQHYALLDPQKTGNEVIFNSKAEAEKHPINVYVERLAAKVVLANVAQADEIEVLYGTDVYSLTFESEAWGLEGLENSGYITKQSGNKSDYEITNVYPTYFFDWINYTDNPRRTFWAESPNSLTIRDYKYAANGLEYETGTNFKKDLDLKYSTYGEITKNNQILTSEDKENYFYTLEHTFKNNEWEKETTANPYSVPTSLVLAGRYKEAKYKRTDDIYKDASNTTNTTPGDISFNDNGFYLRHIDFERTDKEGSIKDDKNNPISKKYQYRLYLEDNGYTGENSNLKNDLYLSLVKEQHTVFVYSETYHSYTNDAKDFIEEYNVEYIPVKENTTYYTVKITNQEAKDELGNTRKDEDGKIIYVKENVSHTISASYIFEINNTHRRLYNNRWIDASNTFTLQLRPDFGFILTNIYQERNGEPIPILYYGIYPTETPTDGEVAKYDLIIGGDNGNVDDINKSLQKQIGYAQFYEKGKAFFYSPVPHYLNAPPITEDSTVPQFRGVFSYEKKDSENSESQPTYTVNNRTGEFGIVRNHIYHFSVDGIKSLGYGIPGDNFIPLPEPIPGKDIYYFDLELKILPWNVFDMQIDI